MKTKNLFLAAPWIILILMSIASCKDSSVEYRTYTANVPKYMSYEDMRKPAKSVAANAIQVSGKIYIKDNYLFINEKYKGIHVFDNTNPSSPVNLTFIDIPGNVDMAVRGNYLYADNYVDLVVLDISNITSPIEVARIKDIFPYTIPDAPEMYPIASIDQQQGVIVGWQVQEVTEEVNSNQGYPYYYYDKGSGNFLFNEASPAVGGAITTQTVGVGGSMARFIINGDQFYGLNQNNMQVVNISQPFRPIAGTKIEMQRNVETVFIDSTYLFVGTQTGMLIYDVSTPATPVFKSLYDHFQSCDPVVVKDKLAYVTLRAGNRCGNWQNLMEVIDLHNIMTPTLMKSYPMTEPYGLGIDNKTLFVCDGSAGLKIYDATDPLQIDQHMLKQYTDLNAYDVIPFGSILIMIAQDGLYQYNYSDLQNIVQLSKIPIGGK
ncbi:MAG: hypothetical protein WCI92_04265 [Bacteroidota bacterium]